MRAQDHIRSISYLKSRAAQISHEAAAGTQFIITQNGEAMPPPVIPANAGIHALPVILANAGIHVFPLAWE